MLYETFSVRSKGQSLEENNQEKETGHCLRVRKSKLGSKLDFWDHYVYLNRQFNGCLKREDGWGLGIVEEDTEADGEVTHDVHFALKVDAQALGRWLWKLDGVYDAAHHSFETKDAKGKQDKAD